MCEFSKMRSEPKRYEMCRTDISDDKHSIIHSESRLVYGQHYSSKSKLTHMLPISTHIFPPFPNCFLALSTALSHKHAKKERLGIMACDYDITVCNVLGWNLRVKIFRKLVFNNVCDCSYFLLLTLISFQTVWLPSIEHKIMYLKLFFPCSDKLHLQGCQAPKREREREKGQIKVFWCNTKFCERNRPKLKSLFAENITLHHSSQISFKANMVCQALQQFWCQWCNQWEPTVS